tara:strand:+ start:5614 stop:6225 length:612 start_codon:yes stop_codon:yes gene_type:complete
MGYVTKNNPIGIDIVINDIIESMYDNLISAGWSNYEAYHRCYKNPKNNDGLFIPEAYTSKYDGGNEYEEVLLNDKFSSTSFFLTGSTTEYSDGNYKVPLSIIFQLNSVELYPKLGHRADEEARNDAIVSIRNSPEGKNIKSIVTDVNNVYSEFDTEGINFSDMSPFHVFRVNLEVLVDYSCDYYCTYPVGGGFGYVNDSGFDN